MKPTWRHLINTYIVGVEPRKKFHRFDQLWSSWSLDRETGIADAISKQPRRPQGEQERDCGNYREQRPPQESIKEQLNDPAFYERCRRCWMRLLSPERQKVQSRIEGYLKRIADLAKRVEAGQAEENAESTEHSRKNAPSITI